MIVIDYDVKRHKEIIDACVHALRSGKVVAYPTDTSYGLAVDVTNVSALRRLYRMKGRAFDQATHVVAPSLSYAKKMVRWNGLAVKLAKAFLPGPLTLVLPIKLFSEWVKLLSGGTWTLGVRFPANEIANALAKGLGNPITALSANPSGMLYNGVDSYTAEEVSSQFQGMKLKPDIIINFGRLKKRKPSTLVRIDGNSFEILRKGPISEKEIREVVGL